MLVAKNSHGDTLEIVKYFVSQSKLIYRFALTYSGEKPFFTGEQFAVKELILSAAHDMALSPLCGCFAESDIVAGIKSSKKNNFTEEQKTALQIAFNVLESGTEQQQIAAFYIKQLIDKGF